MVKDVQSGHAPGYISWLDPDWHDRLDWIGAVWLEQRPVDIRGTAVLIFNHPRLLFHLFLISFSFYFCFLFFCSLDSFFLSFVLFFCTWFLLLSSICYHTLVSFVSCIFYYFKTKEHRNFKNTISNSLNTVSEPPFSLHCNPFPLYLMMFHPSLPLSLFPFLSASPDLVIFYVYHFSHSFLNSFVLLFMILPRYLFTSQPPLPPPRCLFILRLVSYTLSGRCQTKLWS